MTEYARDGENVLIVPVEDVDAAIQGVTRILEDDILRCTLVYKTHSAFQAERHLPRSQLDLSIRSAPA